MYRGQSIDQLQPRHKCHRPTKTQTCIKVLNHPITAINTTPTRPSTASTGETKATRTWHRLTDQCRRQCTELLARQQLLSKLGRELLSRPVCPHPAVREQGMWVLHTVNSNTHITVKLILHYYKNWTVLYCAICAQNLIIKNCSKAHVSRNSYLKTRNFSGHKI